MAQHRWRARRPKRAAIASVSRPSTRRTSTAIGAAGARAARSGGSTSCWRHVQQAGGEIGSTAGPDRPGAPRARWVRSTATVQPRAETGRAQLRGDHVGRAPAQPVDQRCSVFALGHHHQRRGRGMRMGRSARPVRCGSSTASKSPASKGASAGSTTTSKARRRRRPATGLHASPSSSGTSTRSDSRLMARLSRCDRGAWQALCRSIRGAGEGNRTLV